MLPLSCPLQLTGIIVKREEKHFNSHFLSHDIFYLKSKTIKHMDFTNLVVTLWLLQSLWGDLVNFLVTQPKVFHQNFYLNEILGAEKTCQYNTFCRKLRKHQFELC